MVCLYKKKYHFANFFAKKMSNHATAKLTLQSTNKQWLEEHNYLNV